MVIKIGVYLSIILVSSVYSTLYSVSPDFKITYEINHKELAHIYYDQKLNEDGTNYLNAYANSQKSLLEQHKGVGFLQGYVSYKQIFSAFHNLNSFKIKSPSVKVKLQNYLDKQLQFLRKMSQTYSQDLYWQTVFAYLEQCRYAYYGYLQRINEQSRIDMYIGFSQFYYLTSVGDFRQLLPALNQEQTDLRDKSCTVYIRQEGDDFIVTHSTMNYYSYMLRIFKMYNFPTRDARVGSQSISFTARPADFNSKDDYYVASSGLKILETSLLNFRDSNYPQLKPESVPCWLRATVATNLARTGQEWINYFTRYNSGTHNNQWVIVDRNQLKYKKNAIVFLEQAFSLIKIHDMTSKLDQLGFVASYNVPYDQQIYDKMGYEQYPYSFDTDRRLQILKEYHPKMKTIQDMKYWLISNEEEDVRQGIAPRQDLYQADPHPYGIIDCKIITPSTEKQNYYWAISGPSTSNGRFKEFNWAQFPSVSHLGMPNIYNFTWIQVYLNEEAASLAKDKNLVTQ